MPYIKQERREALASGEVAASDLTAGDLNYLLTATVLGYLSAKPKNYESINSVVGALEACKLEFYRRLAAPYEAIKAHENGDMYAEFFGATKPVIALPEQPKIELA